MTQDAAKENVILLHGLAATARSMAKIESALHDAGYHVINYDYPSTKYPIEKLADDAITNALSQCSPTQPIHFVTHSMGGILVRQYLSHKNIPQLGRVIMLAPPNKGSQLVDKLQYVPGFKRFHGPAVMQLRAIPIGIPNTLAAADFELGIIAGNRAINIITSAMLPKPNDGTVPVENTKLRGMTDHITLPVAHTFIMKNNTVIKHIVHFLKNGVFAR